MMDLPDDHRCTWGEGWCTRGPWGRHHPAHNPHPHHHRRQRRPKGPGRTTLTSRAASACTLQGTDRRVTCTYLLPLSLPPPPHPPYPVFPCPPFSPYRFGGDQGRDQATIGEVVKVVADAFGVAADRDVVRLTTPHPTTPTDPYPWPAFTSPNKATHHSHSTRSSPATAAATAAAAAAALLPPPPPPDPPHPPHAAGQPPAPPSLPTTSGAPLKKRRKHNYKDRENAHVFELKMPLLRDQIDGLSFGLARNYIQAINYHLAFRNRLSNPSSHDTVDQKRRVSRGVAVVMRHP